MNKSGLMQNLALKCAELYRKETIVQAILGKMTPEEKLYQLIFTDFGGWRWNNLAEFLSNNTLGGLILMGHNIEGSSYDSLKEKIAKLSSLSTKIPVMICVDQEGGLVQRLKPVIDSFPLPSKILKDKGIDGVAAMAQYFAEKMSDLGIHVDFAPVLDLCPNKNSVVFKRILSESAETNALLGNLFIDKFAEYGMAAVPKHYPGYGTVSADPHYFVCKDTKSELSEIAWPFFQLPGCRMMMTAHVVFTKTDYLPATLSPAALGLLREYFDGVIITDDLRMQSISALYEYKKGALMSLQAGCDAILLITPGLEDWRKNASNMVAYLSAALTNGQLTTAQIDEKAARILRLKLELLSGSEWGILGADEVAEMVKLFPVK